MHIEDVIIDVSHNNGVIAWNRVAAAGIKLAFIKAVEGESFTDPAFIFNKLNAASHGIMVVPYDFLRPALDVGPAAYFEKVAHLAKGTPFMLDWEGAASQTCVPSIAEGIGRTLTGVTGRVPVGYWGMPGSTPAQPSAAMQKWDRFVPRYPQVPQPASYSALHPAAVTKLPFKGSLFVQYTSEGIVPGITGHVDRSVWLGTLEELDAWYKTGAHPVSA